MNTKNERNRKYYSKNKEMITSKNREHYAKNKEKFRLKHRKFYADNKEKILKRTREYTKKYNLSINGRFASYKYAAKDRSLPFLLSIKQFSSFAGKKCFYCGGEIIKIGIDRIDSERGYSLENCVPCCSMCNYMKRNYDVEVFVEHCRKISKQNEPSQQVHV